MRGAKKKTIFLSFSFFSSSSFLVVKRSTFPDDRKKKDGYKKKSRDRRCRFPIISISRTSTFVAGG